jgi:hypothetical protein
MSAAIALLVATIEVFYLGGRWPRHPSDINYCRDCTPAFKGAQNRITRRGTQRSVLFPDGLLGRKPRHFLSGCAPCC